MADVSEVIEAANRLAATEDEASLELLLGIIDEEIARRPELKEKAFLEPRYDATTMGVRDDLRAVGRKILMRWNQELYGLVCGKQTGDHEHREALFAALSLGETAVIGAVAAALLGMGVPAPIAAALAPLIVRKFIWPAKEELCQAWGEAIARTNEPPASP